MDMPPIGLGTWPMQGEECRRAVAEALDPGYRHVDTARMYGNEAAARAGPVRAIGVPNRTPRLPCEAAAERLGRTPAQVALRRIVQSGVVPIPKSSRRERLAANLAALDFVLPPGDMDAIGALTAQNRRFVTPSRAPDRDA